ncbi:MAG TPA: hypothetical protein VK878_14355 [Candidatus Deferrimicrobiaceae bacterium]|nr:hypothetical protein [Candidatus Deferrimicrobiaceae bacterium]
MTRRWLPPALLAAYAAAFGWRALGGGLLVFDDHPGQVYRLAHAITLGLAPWRFNPGWWAGYPELQYYPPGFAWLGALVHLAAGGALDLAAVYRILLWLAWLLPGAATYLLLRRALGEPWLALPGAFVALTLSAGCRSGVEEGLRWGLIAARLGFGALPLLAWSLLRWTGGAARPPLGAAALVAAVTLLHPAHTPAAAVIVLLAALHGPPPRAQRLREGALIFAAGLGLAAIWLLPLLGHLGMALPLAWADAAPGALARRLASQPILLTLAGLGAVAWWRRGRLPAPARWLPALAPAMAGVVALDALVAQPAGVAWLPADRLMDGLDLGFVLAGAAGFAALAAPLARPVVAALLAVALCLPLAWGPGEPGLTLWPRAGEWPREPEITRGLRLDALWEALRQAPPGRVLVLRSAVPLDWRPEWWRPHTHVTALTPLRSGRSIVGGTFTHPAPVAGLVYTGSADPRPLTLLAEQRDAQSLFGQPLEALDTETFNRYARRLGIGSVVALDQDVGRSRFLTENHSVRSLSRIGQFRLFAIPGAAPEPVPLGHQRWRVSVPSPGTGWRSLPVAHSPLWVARAAGRALPTRRDEDGLLAVELSAPLPSVELEHRPGPVEWAGVAVSLGALLLLLGAWWRQVQRA